MEFVADPRRWAKFLSKGGLVLKGCVGTGSFGDVFAVTRTTTGASHAVKRLVARRKISEDHYAMAEIEALMELNHPNIVTLEELLLYPRMVCLVMELAPSGNLEMLLLNEPQPGPDDHFRYLCFRQVTSALCHCHAQDLAHRDINPSNVLIFSHSLVKLADFNLCHRCSKEETTSDNSDSGDDSLELFCEDFLGQDAYLAPEIKRREPFSAKPADIWSLGCLLYFMINGKHIPLDQDFNFPEPLEKSTKPETRRCRSSKSKTYSTNKDSKKRRSLSTLTMIAEPLIRKLCQPNPDNRPSVKEVACVWESNSGYIPDVRHS